MITDKGTELLESLCLLRGGLEENIYEYLSNFLTLVSDHVSEYEEMECMTLCAAVTISFPILNIAHAHKPLWQDFSGILLPGMCTSQSYFDLTP